jgi:MFS family permease
MMTASEVRRFAGWSALVSAAATILGLLTLMLFFVLGNPWGTINDVASVIVALSILPVFVVLHRLHRQRAPTASLAATSLGTLGMIIAIVFQALLIGGKISYAQTAIVVPIAFGVFGIALIVYSGLAIAHRLPPRMLAWLGSAAGAGYIIVIAGFILGGQEHPLTMIGGATALVCYPSWAIWFGRELLSGRQLQLQTAN